VIDKRELDLLVDIARLVKKYGPDAFEALAKSVASPEFSDRLSSILTSMSNAYRAQRQNGGHRKQTKDSRSFLVELSKSDPDRGRPLLEFYDRLAAKSVLPALKELKDFASDVGLTHVTAANRNRAIAELVTEMSRLPAQELQEKLAALKCVPVRDDRSLEGWSKIILGDARRSS
jgi:hypothetical protein